MRGVENPVRRTEDRADPVRGCIPHPANKMFVAVELHDCHGSAWRSAEVTLSANTTAMTSALENMKLTIVPKMNNCMSDISTCGPDWGICITEGFWLI